MKKDWTNKKIAIVTAIVTLIVTIVGSLMIIFEPEIRSGVLNSFSNNPCKSIFDKAQFKILVLKFNKSCPTERGNVDIGEEITYRLKDLKRKDTLDIAVCYQTIPIGIFDEDSTEIIRKKYGADQIIYGRTDYCTADTSQICINYNIDPSSVKDLGIAESFQQQKFKKSDNKFQTFSASGLRDGELQGDIDYLIYIFSGIAASKAKNRSKARTYFTKAIDENPDDKYGYFYRSYYGNFTSIFKDINKALEIDSTFVDAYNLRGYIYSFLKKYNDALADYNKAIDLDPDDARTYNNRGYLYHQDLKKPKQALADYDKAIDLDPDDATAYNNRGGLYHNLKKPKQALADYNKAIDLDPDDARTYSNRGSLYEDLKKPKKALADYNKAIDLDPDDARTYNRLVTY